MLYMYSIKVEKYMLWLFWGSWLHLRLSPWQPRVQPAWSTPVHFCFCTLVFTDAEWIFETKYYVQLLPAKQILSEFKTEIGYLLLSNSLRVKIESLTTAKSHWTRLHIHREVLQVHGAAGFDRESENDIR